MKGKPTHVVPAYVMVRCLHCQTRTIMSDRGNVVAVTLR